MKEDNKTKRYLVTYKDIKIKSTQAMNILGVKKNNFQKGVAFLASEAIPGKEDVLHFENVGISSIELSPKELNVLRSKEGVLAIEEDTEMSVLGYISDKPSLLKPAKATAKANILWNMNLVKAPLAWARGINGTGVNVAILDTGILIGHPDLVISGGVSFVPGVVSYNDGNGHGTHCSGIACGKGITAPNGYNIYGVAPNANLYGVKVLSDSGSGNSSWIIAGLDWCVTNHINVASMSLGGPNAPYTAYATAIQQCQNNGVTVVCASGNSYLLTSPSPPYPFPWVCSPANSFVLGWNNESPVAVGAIDSNSVIASFSSRGGQTANWNQVTVVAPGVNIYSSYLNNGYATLSGTSMACPHVAGFAALIYQKYNTPPISPQMVIARVGATATNLGTAPYPNIPYGYGLINCNAGTL